MSLARFAWTASTKVGLSALWPALMLVLVAGCGGQSADESSQHASAATEAEASAPSALPTVSISGSSTSEPSETETAAESDPAEGTPEWLLDQIREIRMSSIEDLPKEGDEPIDLSQMRAARRQRNEQIVALATEIIKDTHEDPEQEAYFTKAVHELLQARMQLANQGNDADVDALYSDVESLKARDPQSAAAAEGAHTLVMFANNNARRYGQQEPRWLEEFSRQARMFATDFPEDPRAAQALFTAGLSCDLHGVVAEAVNCFATLTRNYPNSPLAAQVPAMMRRLQLVGKQLQFAGPTVEGDFVNIEDYRGRLTLIVFWSTTSPDFQKMLPQLKDATEKYSRYMRVIGVCMDENEAAIDGFLESAQLPWTQIFDPNHRRWDNEIVQYYGVRNIPTVWLVDPRGLVESTHVTAENLDATVQAAIDRARQAAARSR